MPCPLDRPVTDENGANTEKTATRPDTSTYKKTLSPLYLAMPLLSPSR